MESLAMSLAMFGRMFATGAYYICLQYASEIFPTSIRGSGLSACEIVGGIGLFLSPWIVYLVRITLLMHHCANTYYISRNIHIFNNEYI